MQTRRWLWLALATVALLVAAYVLIVRELTSNDDEARTTSAASSDATASTATGPALGGDASGGATPKLDCTKPAGDVARVDDVAIAATRVCEWLAKTGGANPRTVVDQMIDAVLVERAATAANVRATAAELDAVLAEHRADPADPLLREQVRHRVELRKLAAQRTSLAVDEREVDAELAAGAPGIDRGQGMRVEGWIARVAPSADAATRAKSEAAAKQVAAARDPAAVAKQVGMTPLAPFVVGEAAIEPDLQAAAAALAEGERSAPVPTKVGWVVIRALERVAGKALDDRALRERVRRALETRKAAAATKDVMTELRNRARVEILVEL